MSQSDKNRGQIMKNPPFRLLLQSFKCCHRSSTSTSS